MKVAFVQRGEPATGWSDRMSLRPIFSFGPTADGRAANILRMTITDGESHSARIALNRQRQLEIYGELLGDRVRRLTAVLGITQVRLARTLGISPAMLSQLISARRVKIGDPAVLARLTVLDQRCAVARGRPPVAVVERLLTDVARTRWQWSAPSPASQPGSAPASRLAQPRGGGGSGVVSALRTVAAPARLAAAAAVLGPGFPELADVLRQAAARA